MKIGLFNNFGAKNSAPVFQAIAAGLTRLGHTVSYHDNTADVAVIWSMLWAGRMRGNREVYQQFAARGRPVIVAEVGALQRNYTWKLGINGIGFGNYPIHIDNPGRGQQMRIELKNWKRSGKEIVIACQRTDSEQWRGQPDLDTWLRHTVDQIRQHTDRPIKIRPHPRGTVPGVPGCVIERPAHIAHTYDDFDFARSLSNAWAVVNYNSGPGVQSVLSGIPAFVDHSSLASPVGNLDFSTIENPTQPDRSLWLDWLSHCEWTVEEIATGHPLSRLLNNLSL